MRLAVFGDVHGNLRALEAVLRDAQRRGADAIVHLGDLVGAGGASDEVVRRVEAEGLPGVAGDWDLAACRDEGDRAGDAEVVRFLGGLPAQFGVDEGALRLRFVHASPTGPGAPDLGALPDARLGALLEGWGVDVLFYGHTHRPLARRLGERLLLNPGCAGEPVDGDPRPPYLLLDTASGLEVSLVRAQIGVERQRS